MAAYAALTSIKHICARVIRYLDFRMSPPVLKHYKSIHDELKSFQEFLHGMDSNTRKRMKYSLRRIPEKIENFYEVFLSLKEELERSEGEELERSEGEEIEYTRNLLALKQHTDSFYETLKMMKERGYRISLRHQSEAGGDHRPKRVGLSDVFDQLKEDLVGSWVKENLFLLVGMAGIGKTTLAQEIFQDPDILELYDCRAWVTVGREFNSEEITESILAQLGPLMHVKLTGRSEEMFRYLKQYLEGKRNLIVFDDAWDKGVLYYSKKLFSGGDGDRSRFLITSTKRFVAADYPHVINMRLMNEEESWSLLSHKVFGKKDSCPRHLEKAGKKIAEKCDGLPLTIITVADLLLKAEQSPESLWIEVATHKRHQLFADAYDEISKVLYPRYDDLHQDFKSCFLYMAIFPQKTKIPKSKLLNLWIVEKLVELAINQSMEGHLEELTSHSLVVVYQRSSSLIPHNGAERIKTCGLHTSWWQFCQREARKHNFFYVLDWYGDALEEGIKGQGRLSIHNNVLFAIKQVYNSMEENCASSAHSLLCLGPYHKYPVPICFGLHLLRKLDAAQICFYEFPLEVLELVRLRYLALTCNARIPPSISKLGKLKFLIVHKHLSIKYLGAESYLPMEIWEMKKLKHLQVMETDLPNIGDAYLRNLLTLSDVSFDSCTEGVVARMPNLEKLGIRVQLTPDATEPVCCFDHISDPNNLKSLKCVVVNPECKSDVVTSPVHRLPIFSSHLRKLTLSGLGYPWEEMNKIASLPNLEVLKLRCNAFRGPYWEIKKKGFKRLLSLLIEDIDLVELKGRSGSFQCLSKLCIRHCYKLEDLDIRRHNIMSKIEVVDCNPLLDTAIKQLIHSAYDKPNCFSIHSSWKS